MRHPLLRILVALLVGMITPLCCCRATAMLGTECGGWDARDARVARIQGIRIDSCCDRPGNARSNQTQDAPADDQQPSPEHAPTCPACPSCNGTLTGTGINVENRSPVSEHEWDGIVTLALAMALECPPLQTQAVALLSGWVSDPPFLIANREALRWHCALLV